jgi:hypothetical protein
LSEHTHTEWEGGVRDCGSPGAESAHNTSQERAAPKWWHDFAGDLPRKTSQGDTIKVNVIGCWQPFHYKINKDLAADAIRKILLDVG